MRNVEDTQRGLRLDALAKIGLLLAYSIALFVADTPVALGALCLLLVAVMMWARIALGGIARTGAPVYPIALFLFLYNAVTVDLMAGVLVAGRVVLLAWASIALVRLTNDSEMADALRRMMAPFGKMGLPVRDFAMALSLSLRFMPLMAQELAAVRAAQASRGAPFQGAGPLAALKAYGNLMVPVMVGLFRRADCLACAMDARCFGAVENPTSLNAARFGLRDGVVLVVGAALCFVLALGC